MTPEIASVHLYTLYFYEMNIDLLFMIDMNFDMNFV